MTKNLPKLKDGSREFHQYYQFTKIANKINLLIVNEIKSDNEPAESNLHAWQNCSELNKEKYLMNLSV